MRTDNIRVLILLLIAFAAYAQKDYGIHDPAGFVKENDRYYTFYTSNGVEYASSSDLCTWNYGGKIFSSGFPSWITTYVSGFEGHFWAPAVFYMNNRWHVYYSCSTFGSRGSAIGLATTASLSDPQWEDQGMVVYTNSSSDHNAIDPDLMRHDGRIWLAYGSFWSGIVMTELDSTTGKPVDRGDLHYVAGNDPEAAFVMHHGDYYYLMFNRGKCCSGVNSTYVIYVGRSTSPTGPYLDKSGKSTSSGGGTVLLSTNGRFIGPGHFGYIADNGREYMSYHYYDKDQSGTSKLKISTLSWEDGWPVVDSDFDPCNPGTIIDCAGVENGSAYVDQCGTCVAGTTGNEPCQRDCNGDWGGEAVEDACGVCAGGATGIEASCTGSIQGEDAVAFDGAVETDNEGYIGEGYVNTDNETGASITFEMCADAASQYQLNFRYANGGTGNRSLSVTVNGTEMTTVLVAPPTASWTDWKTASIDVMLDAGENSVVLSAVSDDGGPNIDVLTFTDSKVHQCGVSAAKRLERPVRHDGIVFRNDVVSFYANERRSGGLRLYTVNGRCVYAQQTQFKKGVNRLPVNTAGLSTGMYLLRVIGDDGAAVAGKRVSIW